MHRTCFGKCGAHRYVSYVSGMVQRTQQVSTSAFSAFACKMNFLAVMQCNEAHNTDY